MSNSTLQLIVIDPFKKEIRYETVPNPKLTKDYAAFNQHLYDMMSAGPIKVHCMEAAYISSQEAIAQDCVMVDEEGLFHDFSVQRFFLIRNGCPQPLAGIGVATGLDHKGNTIESSLSLDWFKKHVIFLSQEEINRFVRKPL